MASNTPPTRGPTFTEGAERRSASPAIPQFVFEETKPGETPERILQITELQTMMVQYVDSDGTKQTRVCFVVKGKLGGLLPFMLRKRPDPEKDLVVTPETWFVEAFGRMVGAKNPESV